MSTMFAAPQATPLGHAGALSELTHVALALLLVLAVLLALARLLRWARGVGPRAYELLDVVAETPVGQKERAVLLRVGHSQILLGVAPGRVCTLHVLPEPLERAAPSAKPLAAPSFSALLRRGLRS